MQWIIFCYAYCQESVCCWLFGTPEECGLTCGDRSMGLEWYLIHRKWATTFGSRTDVHQSQEPIDAVLAHSESEAESIAEARSGWKVNEWPYAYLCESRQSQKLAAVINDAVNVRTAEFKKFMTLESKRVSKES